MTARREVKVKLDVDMLAARKGIRGGVADVDKLIASTEAAGESLDDMAVDAAKAGRKLDDMAADAAQAARATDKLAAGTRISGKNLKDMKNELGRLDRQIDETVLHLKLLEHQFATTGDKSLLKQIQADRSLVSRLKQIRKDLTPDKLPVTDVLDLIPMKGIGIAAAAVAASALAAPVGAAIAGAVVGGVGLGGIVGGVIAAAHDGRVKDAYAELGHGLGASLKEAGRPFLGPLIHEVTDLGVAGHKGIRILQDGFEKLAPVVRPLVLGLGGFVDKIGPGLGRTFTAAQPAIRALSNELPRIGEALGDMLSTMAEDDRATEGLIGLLHVTEDLIVATGEFIGYLEWQFDLLVKTGTKLDELQNNRLLGNIMASFGFVFEAFTDEATDVSTSLDAAKDSSNDFAHSLDGTASSADEAAEKIKDLNDAIDDLFSKTMSWEEAQIRLRQGMRDLVDELKDGERTLRKNSAEGDKNREAIIRQIQAVESARQSYFNLTGDLAGANRLYQEQLEQIRKHAREILNDDAAVDKLINTFGRIPKQVTTPVTTPGLATAQSRLDRVLDQLNRIDGKRVIATVLVQETHREDARLYRQRWGGITEYAATGVLRDAAIYRPPTRYAFAEPATGGEAFIPKNGPYGRAMSIMSQAAAWYGASVVPHRMAAGGTTVVEHRHVLVVEGTGVMSGLRREITLLGGDVQSVLGSG